MAADESLPAFMRTHLLRLLDEAGIAALVPREVLEEGLRDIELGAGQLLADVERAHRRGVSFADAVHAHDQFPYLGRFHGFLHDAFLLELPEELMPIMRRLQTMQTPTWAQNLLDDFCVVARSTHARPEERALARLLIFEGVRVNLFIAAYRTNGGFEGLGGCRRDLDVLADQQLGALLAIPLEVDASTNYRPFLTTVAAAIDHLQAHVDQLNLQHGLIGELRQACEDRARLEMLLRDADPVDAAVLRNKFDRAHHQQPVPVQRLPLEHPIVLADHNEDSLNQRTSRAVRALMHAPDSLARRARPITLADLILEVESANA